MTDDERNGEPTASTEGEPDYKVGYCRPPKHGQIKPGEVRNKRGKARGTRSLKNDVREILNMPVPLNDPGKKRKVTTRKAALLKLREKALKGDSRSLDRLLDYAREHDLEEGLIANTGTLLEHDQAILARSRERAVRAAAANAAAFGPTDNQQENDR
jgi:hypothetical protein